MSRTHERVLHNLYHGFRTKQEIDVIEKLVTFDKEQAYNEIVAALTFFNKEHLIEKERTARASTVNLIKGMIDESQTDGRFDCVYACPYRDRMERWAIRNPEIIYLTLDYVGISLQDTLGYLTTRFGNPHIAKLKQTLYCKFPQAVVPIKGDILIDAVDWIKSVDGEQILYLRHH